MALPPTAARLRTIREQAAASRVGFVVRFVRLDDIEDLDAKIRQLSSEWELQFVAIEPGSPAYPAWQKWRIDFVPWRAVWSGWKASHVSLWERSGDTEVAEFRDFEAGYNELRRRFVEDLQAMTGTDEQPTGSKGTTTVVSDTLGDIGGVIKLGLFAYFAVLVFKEVQRRKS